MMVFNDFAVLDSKGNILSRGTSLEEAIRAATDWVRNRWTDLEVGTIVGIGIEGASQSVQLFEFFRTTMISCREDCYTATVRFELTMFRLVAFEMQR